MRRFVFAALSVVLAASASAQTAPPPPVAPVPVDIQRTVDRLREAALADDHGYAIVQDLVTQIGPRIAGSEAEARARDWAVAMLRANLRHQILHNGVAMIVR